MENERKTSNGITVYTYPLPHLHEFCISLYIKAGVLYEGEGENGITHFLEHIHFRNLGGIPQSELYRKLQLLGARMNANTYKEFLYFYLVAVPQHFDECMKLFVKLLAPLTATPADVKAERRRIQSEIREDDSASSLECFSNKEIWRGTSLNRLIAGSIKDMEQIDLEMLKAKKAELFTQDNMFFYVTGNYSSNHIDSLCREIETYEIAPTLHVRENTVARPENFQNRNGRVIAKRYDHLSDIQFTFDVEYKKYSIPEIDLLYDILFTGECSRFKMLLSEKKGMLYDFDAYIERYNNIGTLYLQFSVMGSKLLDAIRMTTQVFQSMKTQITAEDLALVLSRYQDNILSDLDYVEGFNFQMAYDNHITNCGYKSVEELRGLYAAVTPQRLEKIAEEIFQPQNLVVSIKGDNRKSTLTTIQGIISQL